MSWIRMDDGWDEHPKVLAVTEPAAMMWLRAIAVCNRRWTGGFIPLGGLQRLTGSSEPLKLAHELADVRVPGCRAGLFDRAEADATGAIVRLKTHEERAVQPAQPRVLVGFYVHDIEVYRKGGTENASQDESDLRAKRSAAGKRGAARRWHGATPSDGTELHPPMANDDTGDGKQPIANDDTGDGKVSLDAGAAPHDAGEGREPGQERTRAQAGEDGKRAIAADGKLATPDPGPDPISPPLVSAGARGTRTGTGTEPDLGSGLATRDVWLDMADRLPILAPLRGDQKWAAELEGTAAIRGTPAADAREAMLDFADKHAGTAYPDRADLVSDVGGFAARAKQIATDRRSAAASRAARDQRGGPLPARTNGHAHGRPPAGRAPQPNPAGAAQLQLDTGHSAEGRRQ